MNRMTKKVQGQLLDISSEEFLTESSVTITLIEVQHPNDYPRYEVSLKVDGYKPELDNKTHLLRLSDDLTGEVFISIPIGEFPSQTQTCFNVNLQDSIWNSLEWFKNL